MWKTTNGLGQLVTWYSEEEYQSIIKLNEANKGLLTATAKQNYSLLQEYDRLRNCLTEIKEIALKSNQAPCLNVDCDCKNCHDDITENGSRCMEYGIEKILQKIREVEQCNKNY